MIQQSAITILPMFFAGEFPHKIEAVLSWVWGGFYGFGLWEFEMLWVWVMEVTLVNLQEQNPLKDINLFQISAYLLKFYPTLLSWDSVKE